MRPVRPWLTNRNYRLHHNCRTWRIQKSDKTQPMRTRPGEHQTQRRDSTEQDNVRQLKRPHAASRGMITQVERQAQVPAILSCVRLPRLGQPMTDKLNKHLLRWVRKPAVRQSALRRVNASLAMAFPPRRPARCAGLFLKETVPLRTPA